MRFNKIPKRSLIYFTITVIMLFIAAVVHIIGLVPTSLTGWLISSTLQMATPLVLAGLGGMFSERGGVVNIGLEGLMLIGAFTAAAVSYYTGNPWLGLIGAVAAGGGLAAVHGIICVKFKGDHIVSGTGIILFGVGFSTVMLEVVWHRKGLGEQVNTIPDIVIEPILDVPILGDVLGVISPIVIGMFIITALCWYVLYKTPFGLRLRAAGEDPSTLDTAGVNVEWTRVIGVILSGCLAGLAGAYLSIGFSSAFGKEMTRGRGFIALAALIFGNWTPVGVLGAGLFFGFLDGLQSTIAIYFPVLLPFANFVAMLPYLLVVVALGVIRRSVPPKGIAVPYEKERSG